jgi:hypothetical protein
MRTAQRFVPHSAWCYQVEPSRDQQQAHAHCWWRGDALEPEHLEIAASRADVGWQIEALGPAHIPHDRLTRPALTYAFKTILDGRPEHSTELWPGALTYLELNGNRLSHQSHGWWLDSSGQPTTKEIAVRDAHGTRDWWLA